jgi:hypothetical protein
VGKWGIAHSISLDNTNARNSKFHLKQIMQVEFKRIFDPPASPDISPSVFVIFGWLRAKVARRPLLKWRLLANQSVKY